MTKPKIAIVADWLTNMGGAEEVVLALAEAFPGAPIYTSTYIPEKMPRFKTLTVRTTWLQNLPMGLAAAHKFIPMLRVQAFQKLDLSDYDIIISSSSAEAKQVKKTRPDQIHICYCHTPVRYYWSHTKQYLKDPGFGIFNWPARIGLSIMLPWLKKADYNAAQKVDLFIANSTETQARILKYYKRKSTVINPPVDVGRFTPARERGNYYVTTGRQVPYKRHDLAVAACTKLGLPLKVIGNGPEHQKLVAIAGPTIEFLTDRFGDASDANLEKALNHAKGYIYCGEEDFGIVLVEALAAGAPVIAYGKGGAGDIVENGVSGVLFSKQTVQAVAAAIRQANSHTFLPGTLRRKSRRFEKSLFITKIQKIVKNSIS